MKHRILSVLLAAVLTLCLASCAKTDDKPKGGSSQTASLPAEDETFTAADAYDLYNACIVRLMEAKAYDIAVDADIDVGASVIKATLAYQFSDDGDACAYCAHEDVGGIMKNDTYYTDGVLTVISRSILSGKATVSQTEQDRETFLEENNTTAFTGGIDIEEESFRDAAIVRKDGTVTVTVVYTDVTEAPAEFDSYVRMFVDPDTATDFAYDDTTVVLVMTEEGELVSMDVQGGLSYTDDAGNPVALSLDATITVNALNDGVTVTPFTEDLLPDESELAEGGSSGLAALLENFGGMGNGGSIEIPEEYRSMIPEEYRQYLQ